MVKKINAGITLAHIFLVVCRLKTVVEQDSVTVMLRTLDIVPPRESSSQKRLGMAGVLKGSNSLICTQHTHTFIRNRDEPYLPLPCYSWYTHLPTPEGSKAGLHENR